MARRLPGNYASYHADRPAECTWVTARNAGVLRSDSYGSCVGLVLHSGAPHKIGVVAHFSGSLSKEQARSDTREILAAVCPIPPGMNWRGWVFGGASLNPQTTLQTMKVVSTKKVDKNIKKFRSAEATKELIDEVKGILRFNQMLDVNQRMVAMEKARYMLSNVYDEMLLDHRSSYAGHQGVRLDVATGKVTWDEGSFGAGGQKQKELISRMF